MMFVRNHALFISINIPLLLNLDAYCISYSVELQPVPFFYLIFLLKIFMRDHVKNRTTEAEVLNNKI